MGWMGTAVAAAVGKIAGKVSGWQATISQTSKTKKP
jgi:hypothetical protein